MPISDRTVRLAALAGLLGSAAMFFGDMLFYGQWGGGAEALSGSYAIVERADPGRLMIGGLLSMAGGVGYVLGSIHIWARLGPAPSWLRGATVGAVLMIAVVATATHAVWGAYALIITTQSAEAANLVSRYLGLHFLIGGAVGGVASLLLLGAILLRRSNWPAWFAVVNPGALYLLLSTATWLPAPFGAPLVGGAFNLAFAVFFLACLLLGTGSGPKPVSGR
ncbi:MAG: putative rane protein [Caulobacter sp.]|nr:putative rane protein [Caulobacter sp.]